MKYCRLLLTSIFLLSVNFTLFGQDVEFINQADIDAFDSSTTEIKGNLTIGSGTGFNNISDLSNLKTLVHIHGNLSIRSTKLVDLTGLESLEKIDSSFNLSTNTSLTNIDALTSLHTINKNIILLNNTSLKNIDGLINLSSSSKTILLWGNNELKNIDGLQGIKLIRQALFIVSNNSLLDINGLSNLKEIGLTLTIESNDSLKNLDGLANLERVKSFLTIENNYSLSDCCGIQELLTSPTGVGTSISIKGNPSECSNIVDIIQSKCNMGIHLLSHTPCLKENNGFIKVILSDYESSPFYYNWFRQEDGITGSGTSITDSFTLKNLSVGTYDITVTNPILDIATRKNIVLGSDPNEIFEIIEWVRTNSSNGLDNGQVTFNLSGGRKPFRLDWEGNKKGNKIAIFSNFIKIEGLTKGQYEFTISDYYGNHKKITTFIDNDTIEHSKCTEPLDIVILNDVSESVNFEEYEESKQFFVDFLEEVNIGNGEKDSRAAIIEWSERTETAIPITGDTFKLQNYINLNRKLNDATYALNALRSGGIYLSNNARPDATKVIILSTDGYNGQITPSLIAEADALKANGFYIVTVAFDDAYKDEYTRNILKAAASLDVLAPGANSYANLNKDLAKNIVNRFICPPDPGRADTVRYHRDGIINIIEANISGTCEEFDSVLISFSIEANGNLSIPTGTFVQFYQNNPFAFGATPLIQWKVPCEIPPSTTDTFLIKIPVNTASDIYVILNDDKSSGVPVNFPITNLIETNYENNFEHIKICTENRPVIQAIKYVENPLPICDTSVTYTVNLCNISDFDGQNITIANEVRQGFKLLEKSVQLNDCATQHGDTFDIAANCCVSITLKYDVSEVQQGIYDDLDVLLNGPENQKYINYLGEDSANEDIYINGEIDCPSTEIVFSKQASHNSICNGDILTYTFYIDNKTNISLENLILIDTIPSNAKWMNEIHSSNHMFIENAIIKDSTILVEINHIDALSKASFSVDVNLDNWLEKGKLINQATLDSVPDFSTGKTKSIISNSTYTTVEIIPPLLGLDTIYIIPNQSWIDVEVVLLDYGTIEWSSQGDGEFRSIHDENTRYFIGDEDKNVGEIYLTAKIKSNCGVGTKNIVAFIDYDCNLTINNETIGECNDNGTPEINNDDTFIYSFNIGIDYATPSEHFYVSDGVRNYGPFNYETDTSITLSANDTLIELTFKDDEIADCLHRTLVKQKNCSDFVSIENDIYIPTAFSPNGDQINDHFTVYPSNVVKEINSIKIFNRWGALVFEEPPYTVTNNSHLNSGWDGTFKGKKMNSNHFAYCVTYTLLNGTTKQKCGEVFLMD